MKPSNITRRIRNIEKILETSKYPGYAIMAYAKFICEVESIHLSDWKERLDRIRKIIFKEIKK